MNHEQANTLRDIAIGSPIVNRERTDTYGQNFIDKSEQWLSNNQALTTDVKLEQWMVNNSNWSFTPNNKQYYWDTLESLTPGSSQNIRNDIIGGVRDTLTSLSTLEDKENHFRDKAHTYPDFVLKDLEEYFFNLRGINDRKNLEKTRLAQIMEVDKINGRMADRLKLAPDVSLETHTKEYLKAYDLGFSEMSTDDNGRISIPVEGIQTPVFSMEDPKLSLEEEFISLNDLTTRVRTFLRPLLKASRAEVKQAEELANKSLLNKITSTTIPEEFKANIIIDGAVYFKNPIAKTNSVINSMISREINNGTYRTSKEVFQRYFSLYKDIHNKLNRRINNGIS